MTTTPDGRTPTEGEFRRGTTGIRTDDRDHDLEVDAAAIAAADVAAWGLERATAIIASRSKDWHRPLAAEARTMAAKAEAMRTIGDSPVRAAETFKATLRQLHREHPRAVDAIDGCTPQE